jgi:CIC family chloride channel protein
MTNDYRIILPLMFSVVVSLLISQRLQSDSVYTLSLLRKGIRLDRGRDLEVLETLTASEVMQTTDTLPASATLSEAAAFFQRSRHHGAPVLDESGRLLGVFTIQDLENVEPADWENRTIREACSREIIVAYPDETAGAVLNRMGFHDIGRMPIVSRDDPGLLIGLVRRADLVRAYALALNRRAVIRHKAHQIRLDASTHTDVSIREVRIQPGAVCENKRIREIVWPQDCILSTLRRGRRVFIPHGDTTLRVGDVLVAVVEGNAGSQLEKICSPQVLD